MDAAQFGNWDYSASLSNTETTEEEHKSHIDWLLTRDPKHNLEIQLLEPHYYSEYGDQTRASLHSTALEKYADKSITGNEIFCAKTEWYD